MPFHIRRKKVASAKDRVDFVDDNGVKYTEFPILHPKFKEWIKIEYKTITDKDIELFDNKTLQDFFFKSPWYGSTANDIDWIKRVRLQSTIQKYISHSISSTINLPEDVSEEEVSRIYLESWKQGLKGVTVYRDGSRSGVLVSSKTPEKLDKFEQHDAPKRPKELKAESYIVTIKGNKYSIIIGLLDGKPYEIFITSYLLKGEGLLIKQKKGEYDFIQLTDSNSVHRVITDNMTDEQIAISRLISTSLRHGANIKFIVEQLNKTPGDMFEFTKGLARVLKKYIPDGAKSTITCNNCGSSNVVFEEGCQTCKDCGHSKCG